ncbi:hypothetical protein TI39_contig5832g00038 [Zymoseptoria brevis]|uniref:Uncharacterized protein n=1 Tax=Zymoseptoria brevis TaxID=1047168 RepID=A0A0F4G6K0_9PEZI|nr:hypothetical protein TI39_contig5832g00038 [Zymoseptoria brevis]
MTYPTSRSDYGAITYYGNTQAVVLDTFRNGAGQLRNYNAPGLDSNGRPCKTWVRERQRRLKTFTRMLERNDYSGRHPAGCQTATSALRPYAAYNKLFGERKYAANYPFVKNSSSLMDLPGEIRNRIYRLHLLDRRSGPKAAERASKHAKERFTKIRTSRLKFLRLSKTVNKEAGDIIYGENEFRFTEDLTDRGMGGYETIVKALERPARQSMWTMQDFKDSIDILNGAGNLEQLKLVLPANLEVDSVVDLKFDLSRFTEGLDITLVHMAFKGWCGRDIATIHESQLPLTKSELVRRVKKGGRKVKKRKNVVELGDPKTYAETMGWEYERAWADGDGHYHHEPLDHVSACCWYDGSNCQ